MVTFIVIGLLVVGVGAYFVTRKKASAPSAVVTPADLKDPNNTNTPTKIP